MKNQKKFENQGEMCILFKKELSYQTCENIIMTLASSMVFSFDFFFYLFIGL
jgi:hypothetical protein